MTGISILVLNIANGQETPMSDTDYRDKISFGFKVGVNVSNVYDSQGEEFRANAKVGFATGAFLAVPIGKYLGIQPELLLSQKGFKASGRFIGDPYTLTRTTTYIDIPLLGSFKPSEFFTLVAGPMYSYLLNKTDKLENDFTSIEQETDFENDNIRKNTLGITGGFDLNIKHIVISARAAWDMMKNDGNGSSTNPRYKNTWYQFTAGYRF